MKVEATTYNPTSGKISVRLTNTSKTVAFANRIRLVNAKTGERILPAIMTDGYVTLLPGESKTIGIEAPAAQLRDGATVLVKQFGKKERVGCKLVPGQI